MKKFLGIALVVVMVVIAIGGGYFFPKFTSQAPKVGISTSVDSGDCTYVNDGGVDYAYCSKSLAATSSVLASFKNPWYGNFRAALVTFTAHGTTTDAGVGGMGDQLVDLATSTTPYATSSPAYLKEFSIPTTAGERYWPLVWSGSATTTNARLLGEEPGTTGKTNNIIGISEYLNLRVSTTTAPGTFTTYESGTAHAVFMKI